MAALATTYPTLLDVTKRLDPNGKIDAVGEILNETNQMLPDAVFKEGNLPTGHRVTVRTGIPTPTWRKLNGGITPKKSRTAQITFNTGMLEALAEVDVRVANLNGNSPEWRLSEDKAFIEGMSVEMQDTLLYGNEGTEPEAFTGIMPYYNSLSAESAQNIVVGGGSGTDNASILLVTWGDDVHCIYPKGSKAGLDVTDYGKVWIENVDAANGRMLALRTHYTWDAGLVVRDWRQAGRIPNIDKSALLADASSGANLPRLMFELSRKIHNPSAGRQAWYMSRDVATRLFQQISALTKESTLGSMDVGGKKVDSFLNIPLRRVDAMSADETLVA
jgi:hypothetical protein